MDHVTFCLDKEEWLIIAVSRRIDHEPSGQVLGGSLLLFRNDADLLGRIGISPAEKNNDLCHATCSFYHGVCYGCEVRFCAVFGLAY